MEGCINLFRAIDPGVRRIETYAGGQRDTFYWRDDRDRWCASTTADVTSAERQFAHSNDA
jgi:hypothetical protein